MHSSPQQLALLAGSVAQALVRAFGRNQNFDALALECAISFDAQRPQLATPPGGAGALDDLVALIDTTAERLKAKGYDPAMLSAFDVGFAAGQVSIYAANPEAAETDTWACDPIDPAATPDQ